MTDNTPPPYLYLHGIDEFNLELYRQRLREMFAIVNDENVEEGYVDGSNVAFFRQQMGEELDPGSGERVHTYRELRASIIKMKGVFQPVLCCEVVHSSCVADYAVCEIIPEGTKIEVSDFDQILDAIERWQDMTTRSFTCEGHVGQAYLDEVSRKETKAFRVLNALIHAYIELGDEEKFTIVVEPRKPYAASTFYQLVGGHRFEFLTPETKAAIDALFPPLVKLHFSAAQSVMTYWLGTPDVDNCVVEKDTLPKDVALPHILKGLMGLPQPHLLDEPELVEE